MKKTLALLLSSLTFWTSAHAEPTLTPAQIAGDWSGTLDSQIFNGTMVLHITETNGVLSATVDLVQQSCFQIPLEWIWQEENALKFHFGVAHSDFTGTFNPAGNQLTGQFTTQHRDSVPLTLTKKVAAPPMVEAPAVKEEPKPPAKPKAPPPAPKTDKPKKPEEPKQAQDPKKSK